MGNYDYLESFNRLPKNIQEIILEKNATWILDYQMSGFDLTPIEIMLFIELEKINNELGKPYLIEPQYPIIHGDNLYYVDFLLMKHPCNKETKKDVELVVECDGYEFHQKSKKQVDYDNQREYDIKTEGYDVLRFSGTEIFKNPENTAQKIFKYIKETVVINDD